MFDFIIRLSLKHRVAVLCAALAVIVAGIYSAIRLPIDVLPDLNRPRVVVLTESHGLAPEEVEKRVTIPLENAFNGLDDSIAIRSTSKAGLSMIYVEFDWGSDLEAARQQVATAVEVAKSQLPSDLQPVLGKPTSIMGEIQYVGVFPKKGQKASPSELRDIARYQLKPKLQSLPGVSNVIVMGGDLKQYRIQVDLDKLMATGFTPEDLKHAFSHIGVDSTGGYTAIDDKEYLIRPRSALKSADELNHLLIGTIGPKAVRVGDIATIVETAKAKRGEASVNGTPAVIMTVQKEPNANTLELTKLIDSTLEELRPSLPAAIGLKSDLFKQATFIDNAISNVLEALRDGTIIVAIVIFLFLLNFKATTITLLAIPLSFLLSLVTFSLLDLSINTMTLGGLAIAIGELVDDAIVDVENVFRRLRENFALPEDKRQNPLRVVLNASLEIRSSIVISTLIVVLVFVPLLALEGMEGRLFFPLGVAYILSITASLVVATTITPVLCYLLLGKKGHLAEKESSLVTAMKNLTRPLVDGAIRFPKTTIATVTAIFLVVALVVVPKLGRDFLPKFNENTATLGIASFPGISLEASNALGKKIEEAILKVPEAKSTIRRTGRAEEDEHAEGIHWHEIDVDFHPIKREREQVLSDIRANIAEVGDVYVDVGQPISHRLDHLLSGVRSEIALKIFGPDLGTLRLLSGDIQDAISDVKGLVDIQGEPMVEIPQIKIDVDLKKASAKGLHAGELTEDLEWLMAGEVVTTLYENHKPREVFVQIGEELRKDHEKLSDTVIRKDPYIGPIMLGEVAEVYTSTGPNMINRENQGRRIIVQANTSDRDVHSVMADIKKAIAANVDMPAGYALRYEGRYKAQQRSTERTLLLGGLSLLIVFVILWFKFRSVLLSMQVLINIPLALIGSILALWATGNSISIPAIVAFITLCGIASRNGVMMISHYIHLMKEEGQPFDKKTVIRGTLERLVPVCMTSLTAILALLPLALSQGEPGKEILYPLSIVIIGGLATSTLLDIFITPAVFYHYGKSAVTRLKKDSPWHHKMDEWTQKSST